MFTMPRFNRQRLLVACVMAAAAGPPVFADEPVGGSPPPLPGELSKYVPADVFLVSEKQATPEHAFIRQHWSRVFKALRTSGIDRELRATFSSVMPEQDRAAFHERWDGMIERVGAVRWGDLAGKSMLFAERFGGIFPDVFVLFHAEPDTVEQNVQALADILRALASFADEGNVVFSEATVDGVHLWAIDVREAPVGAYLLHRGDIVGIVLGRAGKQDVLALMSGKPGVTSAADSPRLRAALAQLPPAEHDYMFLDFNRMFDAIRKLPQAMVGRAQELDGKPSESAPDADSTAHTSSNGVELASNPDESPEAQVWLKLTAAILEQVDIVDYIAMTSRMDGRQELSDTITRIKPAAADTAACCSFAKQRAFESIHRYVPVEATAFNLWSGVDLGPLYTWGLELIRTHVPGGQDVLVKWEQLQRDWDFNVEDDLLSWISGETISVTLPRATPTPFGNEESVCLIRVRDPAKARAKTEAGLKRIAAFLTDRGQPLEITPVEGLPAEGFQRIDQPLMAAMMVRPVIGVWENWLVLGQTDHGVRLVLKTATGKHPTILENQRFREEGLTVDGPVYAATYCDLSKVGEQLTALFVGLGFAVGSLPDDPELRPVRGMFRSLTSLAPVVNEINFMSTRSTVTTRNGDLWLTRSKTTYLPPRSATTAQE